MLQSTSFLCSFSPFLQCVLFSFAFFYIVCLLFLYSLTFLVYLLFFFFNDTAPTEIYTLSLHDALPISGRSGPGRHRRDVRHRRLPGLDEDPGVLPRPFRREAATARRDGEGAALPSLLAGIDRKSTRLNSSHTVISYAVFCLKKKKNNTK